MLVAALTVPLAVVGAGPPAASGHPADKPTDSIHEIPELIGITKPAKTASLGPVNAQTLATLHVTEGTTVQSGEPLFSFDDTTQRVRVATARAEAESTLDVELAKAQWEKAKLEYEWFLSLDTGNNASSKELNDSRADMEIARLEFELAKFELAQSQRAYESRSTNCILRPLSPATSRRSCMNPAKRSTSRSPFSRWSNSTRSISP